VGAAVSIAQLISSSVVAGSNSSDSLDSDQSRRAAFIFYIIGLTFALTVFACHAGLHRLSFYKLVMKSHERKSKEEKNRRDSIMSLSQTDVTIWKVLKKIWIYSLSILLVFSITFSLFPAITSSIHSIRKEIPKSQEFFQDDLFIPFSFMIFNVGDWIGRSLPKWKKLVWGGKFSLGLTSVSRVIFIVS
jgi:solute carrier family 29 (equilibrative nucleoside transporter), member 1/2/3